jgi:hypothetical protein
MTDTTDETEVIQAEIVEFDEYDNGEGGEVALVDNTEITRDDVLESIRQATSDLQAAREQILWQIKVRAWERLGYADWNEMREQEYGGVTVLVPRQERPELVAALYNQGGLSQREIASTLGTSLGTVNNDLKDAEVPATRTDSSGREQPTRKGERDEEPDVVEGELAKPLTKAAQFVKVMRKINRLFGPDGDAPRTLSPKREVIKMGSEARLSYLDQIDEAQKVLTTWAEYLGEIEAVEGPKEAARLAAEQQEDEATEG